ncbi:MAG: hypothetical protein BGO41_08055 [Clostridiales bacterium 38-18]|nr:MAG: hypothetical protein BGO41_08055 [Clostridiales bacterium 38-18]
MKKAIIAVLIIICLVLTLLISKKEKPIENVYLQPESGLTRVNAIEQTEVMVHPDFVKPPYEPVIPKGINLAIEGKVTVSSFVQAYNARKVNDGKTSGASYWEAESNSFPNTLEIDLGEVHTVHTIKVMLNPEANWGERTQSFSIEAAVTTENYSLIKVSQDYLFTPDQLNEVVIEFEPTDVRWIKLEFTSNTGANGAQVAELEVYGD